MALSLQHSSTIFGPNEAFRVNYIIVIMLPVFPVYYFTVSDHHYDIHYHTVVTTLLTFITVIMTPLLLIITYVLPNY